MHYLRALFFQLFDSFIQLRSTLLVVLSRLIKFIDLFICHAHNMGLSDRNAIAHVCEGSKRRRTKLLNILILVL